MLCLVGVVCKQYVVEVGAAGSRLPDVLCPLPECGRRLEGHGGYLRYLGGKRVWMRRVVCRPCGVSHVLAPEDLVAYRDLTLGELESAWRARGPTEAARSQGAADEAAIRRLRAVKHRLRVHVDAQVRSFVPAVPEPGPAGLERVFGSSGGLLVRVRAWLWSKLGLLWSGLSGLWRHGRPRWVDRGPPPTPW